MLCSTTVGRTVLSVGRPPTARSVGNRPSRRNPIARALARSTELVPRSIYLVALQYRTPIYEQGNWPRLDFLFENGRVLHEIQINNSRISCVPVNISLIFRVARVLIVNNRCPVLL